MPTVAFIESNTTGSGKLLLEKAIRRGFDPIFITAKPEKYGFLYELMVSPTVLDTTEAGAIVQFLSSIRDLKAVFSSSEYYVGVAATVAQQFGLVSNSPGAISCCRNKQELATVLKAAGISCPLTVAVTSLANIEAALEEFSPPFIVKPCSGSGSCFVKLCYSQQEGLAHMRDILATNQVGLIQAFVPGTEYSVETITKEGNTTFVGITRKYLGQEPYFVELGHDFPAALPSEVQADIQRTVEAALGAVGFTFGAAHTELRLSEAGVTIIEINPRLAGGMIPTVIQSACGIDLLEVLLDIHLGQALLLEPRNQKYASIRFLLPDTEMVLDQVDGLEIPPKLPGIVTCQQIRKAGEVVGGNHDFKDRVAYVIAAGDTPQMAIDRADSALYTLAVIGEPVDKTPQPDRLVSTGRLKSTLSPDIRALVFPPADPEKLCAELNRIVTLDEAHLVMLVEQKIIEAPVARALLEKILELKQDPQILLEREAPRGLYLLYESVLAELLDPEIAGVLQTARSRNDMNATVFKLSVRDHWNDVFKAIWQLRDRLLQRMSKETETAFPIYSQYQTALPGTFSHYLLAIEESLFRCAQELLALLPIINQCPLGAGGGGGTIWPINQARLAELLGFSSVHINSLDAVSSRDLGLRYLSALNNIGVMLSRVAQDFQLWTTQEFNLIQLPDSLSGGSSMMPQKKNPYLLEWIKAKACIPMGALTSLSMTLAKTPFSNSYEVSANAQASLDSPTQACLGAMQVLGAIATQLEINQPMSSSRILNGLTFSTLIADKYVQAEGVSFRTAHHRVGETIRSALDAHTSPLKALQETFPGMDGYSPLAWANLLAYGGGPGEAAIHQAIDKTQKRLLEDADLLRAISERWELAEKSRWQAVSDLIYEKNA